MATINRIGFGQVEPNHLSAQRTAQIYAQLPADSSIKTLENGQFAKYDYATGKVNFSGNGEWLMVFNEVKLYEPRQTYKDFALLSDKAVDGEIVPRLFKINVGDIFTTNCLEAANVSGSAKVTGTETISVGTILAPNATGYLSTSGDTTNIKLEVVKIYNLADGQDAVKVMRIA